MISGAKTASTIHSENKLTNRICQVISSTPINEKTNGK
jgi:hypothetical protein